MHRHGGECNIPARAAFPVGRRSCFIRFPRTLRSPCMTDPRSAHCASSCANAAVSSPPPCAWPPPNIWPMACSPFLSRPRRATSPATGRWMARSRCTPGRCSCPPDCSTACRCCRETLRFAPWRPGEALATNRFGIPEPDVGCSARSLREQMALVVAPLVGFDARATGSAWAAAGTIAASHSGTAGGPALAGRRGVCRATDR